MGVARKRYSPSEIAEIIHLNQEGWTQKAIAEKIRPGIKTAWRSIGEIIRSHRADPSATTQKPRVVPGDDASRKHKIGASSHLFNSSAALPAELQDSNTAREIMSMLDSEQQALFISAYNDLRGEADEEQVTRAENDMLIRAAFTHTQYLRAAKMYHQCESFLLMDVNGELDDPKDPRKRMAGRGDAYKKEMETKHKEYMELIDGLKLKRSQRLDKIKDTRNTFLDLQEELTSQERRDSLVEEIKRINRATKDEFHRMAKGEVGPDGQKHPWLIGAFDEISEREKEVKLEEITPNIPERESEN